VASPQAGPRLVVGDAARAVALLSVLIAAWRWGPVGAVLFLLVLGGTVVPRAVRARTALDVACVATFLVAAWAAQLDWYVTVPWLDVAVHAVATGLIAVLALRVLLTWATAARARDLGSWVVATIVVGAGALLAVLWELGEWFGHTQLDPRIQVGYGDTLGDLAAGLAGSVVAAVVVVRLPDGGPRS
jgi:hypothetical protein